MTHDEAIAREAIRQTITNYTIAGDIRDAELFSTQFAEDGILEMDDRPPIRFDLKGRDAIHAMVSGYKSLPPDTPMLKSYVRHNITTCHIALTGKDTATAKTYFIVMTDVGPDHAGTYTDKLVRKGERWLFAHRRIALDWTAPNSIYFPQQAS